MKLIKNEWDVRRLNWIMVCIAITWLWNRIYTWKTTLSAYMNLWIMWHFVVLILLSFNISCKLSPEFLSLLPPLKHLENTVPHLQIPLHACTAIIEFLLFFKVIWMKPSPLAIFMFMPLQFQLWMTAAFWWGPFMATAHHSHTDTHTRIHTHVESHCVCLRADKSFSCHCFPPLLMTSFE